MGPLSKLAGQGIGITKEWQAQRSRSKSPQPPHDDEEAPQLVDSEEDADPLDADEAQWALDDAQAPLEHPDAREEDDKNDVDKILAKFIAKHPPPSCEQALQPLPLPVIIPQKRPGTKLKGFIHAYAPVLEDSGIDQPTWFDFLNSLQKCIKYSPTFHAVNGAVALAAMATSIAAGPMVIVHATAWAIHTSIETSRRGYIRYASNKYLDSMNEQLFKPRGLYVMMMAYKPKSHKANVEIDTNQNIQDSITKRADGKGGKLGGASGETHNPWELPESAPLIFPEIDEAQEKGDEGKAKQGGHFLADYMNRRARAKFEHENPDAEQLHAGQDREFASRYSDPNHPASSGNPINLITGGKVNRPTVKERIGGRRQGLMGRRGQRQGILGRGLIGQGREKITGSQKPGGLVGTARRKMHEDVVYLMVVNLPSDEEMARVKQEMEANGMKFEM